MIRLCGEGGKAVTGVRQFRAKKGKKGRKRKEKKRIELDDFGTGTKGIRE